jgi:sulfite reductase beta subunit-like hemoprotein
MAAKLNMEEVKHRKDGLDAIDALRRGAENPDQPIDPEDLALFRWHGIYQQRPNEGHYMLRIKVPNGDLQANQLREIGRIANEHGRGLCDITTRQNFQLHWVRIESLPEILRRLSAVGMTTLFACGDVTRNVVGCPVAGIARDEIVDGSALARHISGYFTGNREFSNLPRKYKISLSGCREQCAQPDINDVGLYGAEWELHGRNQRGFGLKVGGGLSTKPFFAADMETFLLPEEVFEVVRAITCIFRDSEELRQDRSKARLKFLVHDPKIGVGAERFRAMIEERLGRALRKAGPFPAPRNAETDHLGIHPQKQQGMHFVGIGVTVGRLNGDQLQRIADISDEFSANARVRNTKKQNFIITDVPDDRLDALRSRLQAHGFDDSPSFFKSGVVSCTGIEFCNLAVTETKELGRRVAEDLESRFPGAQKAVRIHFSGCPNNCGQNAIADIGMRGCLTKVDGEMVQAFDILLGGATGSDRAFGEAVCRKIPATMITDAIANLYKAFLAWSKNGETFQEFVREQGSEALDTCARQGLPLPAKPDKPTASA